MKEKETERILSVSKNFVNETFLEELEVRLETDPLLPGGLVSLVEDDICFCADGGTLNCPCLVSPDNKVCYCAGMGSELNA